MLIPNISVGIPSTPSFDNTIFAEIPRWVGMMNSMAFSKNSINFFGTWSARSGAGTMSMRFDEIFINVAYLITPSVLATPLNNNKIIKYWKMTIEINISNTYQRWNAIVASIRIHESIRRKNTCRRMSKRFRRSSTTWSCIVSVIFIILLFYFISSNY